MSLTTTTRKFRAGSGNRGYSLPETLEHFARFGISRSPGESCCIRRESFKKMTTELKRMWMKRRDLIGTPEAAP